MEEVLIRITPDREKAGSILKMVETTLAMIKDIDAGRFPSNVIREYYDVIRELISVVLLLDGYKTYGEGAHKKLIEYLKSNYEEFSHHEISLIDDLRSTRNKIAYDGFFVERDYVERRLDGINGIIGKLKCLINKKLVQK
jgi:hypothetical protein